MQLLCSAALPLWLLLAQRLHDCLSLSGSTPSQSTGAPAESTLPGWLRCTCPAHDSAGCVCPSLDPPGGLPPAAAPQFILFSHDDAITEETDAGLRAILEHGRRLSPGACPAVATLFTLARATSAWLPGWQELRSVAELLPASNP
jgi:hypothetical protein